MPIPGLLTLCRSCGAERSRFLRSRLPSANPALPEIPTTREAGLEEFRVAFAPRDTPKPILDTLSDARSIRRLTIRKLATACSILAAMFPQSRDEARHR
jgi:hypothetical protein